MCYGRLAFEKVGRWNLLHLVLAKGRKKRVRYLTRFLQNECPLTSNLFIPQLEVETVKALFRIGNEQRRRYSDR